MKKTLLMAFSALAAILLCSNMQAAGPKIGIQLYSARSIIGSPDKYSAQQKTVLKQLADMGYSYVETASYMDGMIYGKKPKEFKSDCRAAGLTPLSTHTTRNLTAEELNAGKPDDSTIKWWKECIRTHKAAGMKYIVVPSVFFASTETKVPATLTELQVYCDYLNLIGEMVTDAGLEFGYHNHSFEFSKVAGEVMYDYMLSHTNPQYVFFEMDVYWTVIGKSSPVEYFKKYPGRFKLLHIKDHKEIGQSGMVGFDAIFANAHIAGAQAVIVEVERYSHNDVMKSIAESAEYLKEAKFVREWSKTVK